MPVTPTAASFLSRPESPRGEAVRVRVRVRVRVLGRLESSHTGLGPSAWEQRGLRVQGHSHWRLLLVDEGCA